MPTKYQTDEDRRRAQKALDAIWTAYTALNGIYPPGQGVTDAQEFLMAARDEIIPAE